MIDKEHAIRLVEALLEQHNQARAVEPPMPETAVAGVTEHPLCWAVNVDSAEFVRTGDSRHQLIPGSLYLVDRLDGSIHQISSTAFAVWDWEPGYRQLVRDERPELGFLRWLWGRSTADVVHHVTPIKGPVSHP
ncbi:YrhB domain-containing protein [Streptomyces sp. NPDC001982]|uniref:YrhB domain-containing protein n=1 Tax=Streptomyces sp. NPDC001982 TaxID=3154405 RepID=UPI0033239837